MNEILQNYKKAKDDYNIAIKKNNEDLSNSVITKEEFGKSMTQADNAFKAFIGQNYATVKNYVFEKLEFIIDLYTTIREYNAQMQEIDSRVIMNNEEFNDFNSKLTFNIKNSTLDTEVLNNLYVIQDMLTIYHKLLFKDALPRTEVKNHDTALKQNAQTSTKKEEQKEKVSVKPWIKFLPTIIFVTLLIIAYIIYYYVLY